MQKWEYLEMEVTIGGPISGTKGHLWVFKTNGRHGENSGNYGTLLAKLGDEGWEIITSSARIATGLGGKHKINYMFKRPKPEE